MHGKQYLRAWCALFYFLRERNFKLGQKLASICSLALREIDEHLYSRILLLLSTDSPISNNLAQEAALKATTVLVRRYFDCHINKFYI